MQHSKRATDCADGAAPKNAHIVTTSVCRKHKDSMYTLDTHNIMNNMSLPLLHSIHHAQHVSSTGVMERLNIVVLH